MENKEYTSPIGVTSQFRFCGAAFRIDLYKGCTYGCEYCFINNQHENNPKMGDRNKELSFANLDKIERLFNNAINKNQTNTLDKELINRRTPLHLGGNSDPFQKFDYSLELTNKFLQISKKYNYPILISTKGILTKEYISQLDNKLHAFQISLFSDNEETIKTFEKNTYSVKERIEFIKLLHSLGFWVSLRIQPLIDLNEAISLIDKVINDVNFITVEHIKLQSGNKKSVEKIQNLVPDMKFKHKGNSMVLDVNYKLNNIKKIKEFVNNRVKLGFGDNEFHSYSDTNNCCGIDTINENFNNWLNYNSLTIHNNIHNGFIPKNKINVFPYIKKTGESYKDYVDYYVKKYPYFKEELTLF